jgi:hypothetical protein
MAANQNRQRSGPNGARSLLMRENGNARIRKHKGEWLRIALTSCRMERESWIALPEDQASAAGGFGRRKRNKLWNVTGQESSFNRAGNENFDEVRK